MDVAAALDPPLYTLIITYRQDKNKSKTENYTKTGSGYIKNKKKIVPGKQTYAETAKNIRKIGIIGDSHIERLNKTHFNEKINGKVYVNVFQGVNMKCLHHFIQSTLHEDNIDTVLIHL